jgi:D-glycerate 3-kinase
MPAHAHPQPADRYPPAFVERVLEDALQCIGPERGGACYGIAGLQGSGKSTLARQVAALAARGGRAVVVLSIDDVYLDRPQRDAMARKVHPLLATRGPPGTHDVALACDLLDALHAGRSVALPRFDKLSYRRLPREDWSLSSRAEPGSDPGQGLVIFEGWCLRVPPEPVSALAEPCNPLERDQDPDGTWRRYCNDALERDYPPLWQRIHRMLFLQPPAFDVVPGWRWQQEQALAASQPERSAMDRTRVNRFVQHFERVSRQALRTLPALADVVVPLDARRRPLDWCASPAAPRSRSAG